MNNRPGPSLCMPKPFMVERGSTISAGLLVLGLALLVVGAVGILGPDDLGMGDGALFILIVGALLLSAGIAWMGAHLNRVKKFHVLLSENKKATFIRNLDEVEYLAWKLPTRFEVELAERKRKMGLG